MCYTQFTVPFELSVFARCSPLCRELLCDRCAPQDRYIEYYNTGTLVLKVKLWIQDPVLSCGPGLWVVVYVAGIAPLLPENLPDFTHLGRISVALGFLCVGVLTSG